MQVAATDAQGAGVDTARVEIQIDGALTVSGTAASPVTFVGAVTGSSTWYGIIIGAGATAASLQHVSIQNASAAVTSNEPTGSALTIQGAQLASNTVGIIITAGTPTLDALTIATTGSAIDLTGGTSAITGSVITGARPPSRPTAAPASTVATSTVTQCTIAIYGNTSGTLTVRDSIVAQNTDYGIYHASGSAITVTNSDVWGNNPANYVGAAAGAASFSSNPLFVSSSNLRLTSNSPARFAGDTGADIGALPYTSDATPGPYGTLWVNTHLTLAGSPYSVAGDLTVPAGVTLTIDPGVTLWRRPRISWPPAETPRASSCW